MNNYSNLTSVQFTWFLATIKTVKVDRLGRIDIVSRDCLKTAQADDLVLASSSRFFGGTFLSHLGLQLLLTDTNLNGDDVSRLEN